MERSSNIYCEPANGIIKKLGGVTIVAEALGLNSASVRRWRYAPPKGTGGVIPEAQRMPLMVLAKKRDVALEYTEFKPA